MMDKLTIKVTTNPMQIEAKNCPAIKFRKLRVSSLVYSPQTNTAGPINLKIETGSHFDKTIEYGSFRKYFVIKSIVKDVSFGWVNISNCNDWDYCQQEEENLTDFTIWIYEDGNLISSAYLSANPLNLELTFKQ